MKRMLLNVISAVILIFAGTFGPIRVQAQASQPNVMFIIVDDLRPQLGAYGYQQMVTPNMDALANRGMLFENAYIMQATCAPSRACIMTGLRPDSTGIYDLETPVRKVLPDILTLPQYFKNNGYETISIGKVYHDVEDDPQGWTQTPFRATEVGAKKGYQTAEAKKIAAAYPFGPPYESADVPDNAYADGKDTDYAIQVLQRLKAQNKPFFMALGLNKPHLPFTAPKKYWDLYSPDDIELSLAAEEPEGMSPFSLTTWGELRRWYGMPKGENPMPADEARRLIHGYYAAVSYSDAQIGRVLAELDRLQLSSNTIVVLIGDHGWKLGDHSAWSKHSNFEIDTRVPLIIRTPAMMSGDTEAGLHTNTIVESIDLYPTISELAGLPVPEHVEGLSLVPLFTDPVAEGKGFAVSQFPRGPADGGNNFVHRDEYGLTDERLGEGIMGYGLRIPGYRYVEWFALSGSKLYPVKSVLGVNVPTRELYDEEKDPLENTNVANEAAYRDIVASMSSRLRQLLADKLGEVWFSTPERGELLNGPTPVRIGSLRPDYTTVRVELDNMVLSEGATPPQDLILHPEELAVGVHHLAIVAVDGQGVTYKQSTEFTVEHVRISGLTSGANLMSETSLHPILRIPEGSIQQASVTLVPVSEDANQTPHLVYTGSSLPSILPVNTLTFPDGAYDLIVNITLNSGISSSLKQRVVIDNWEIIEDGLLPPAQTAWFGITDNLEVTDRSQGWIFIGDATHLLFGDADRVAPGSKSEYLTWEMPKLQRFEFAVYAQVEDLNDVVRVSLSADGQEWRDAPYSIRLMEKSDTNWMNVRIEGALPTESTAKYIRLTFNTSNHTQAEFQLGNAILQGAKFGR